MAHRNCAGWEGAHHRRIRCRQPFMLASARYTTQSPHVCGTHSMTAAGGPHRDAIAQRTVLIAGGRLTPFLLPRALNVRRLRRKLPGTMSQACAPMTTEVNNCGGLRRQCHAISPSTAVVTESSCLVTFSSGQNRQTWASRLMPRASTGTNKGEWHGDEVASAGAPPPLSHGPGQPRRHRG